MIRILHVVTFMGRGGLECWLMEVLRRVNRDKYYFDIVVQSDREAVYNQEIKELGFKVIYCAGRGNPLIFAKKFAKILDEYGPYDVVHSHLHHFSVLPLGVAKLKGIKVCIAHCHSVAYGRKSDLDWNTRVYLYLSELMLNKIVDYGLGCSTEATVDLFGAGWRVAGSREVLHCGINIPVPASLSAIRDLKRSLGIADTLKVIGHVGRFSYPKNHTFLLDIVELLVTKRHDFVVLLVGDGKFRKQCEERIANSSLLLSRVKFLGVREDVESLLQIMDVFLFPSHYEGLGLSLVEAQAAGLQCLVSDGIPHESHVVPELVLAVPLQKSAEYWCAKLNEILDTKTKKAELGLLTVKESTHNIENCVSRLECLYEELVQLPNNNDS